MNKLFALAATTLAVLAGPALAAGDHGHHGTASPAASGAGAQPAQADGEMTEGEVRKIDKENKKVTLKHGELKNLGMPPMTMVFQVKDPALLEGIEPGAKVRFSAEKVDGAFVVTRMNPVK